MTSVLRLGDGSTVVLGTVLARAGEGTIHEVVGRPDWVAKIFHPHLKELAAKRDKVAAMVASPPENMIQPDGFVVLTWPLHTVEGDGVSGYIMSRIDTADAVEIHSVSNPSGRMNPLPSAPQWTPHVTWHHLVSVAANLCLAVETVHKVNAVIGDFQERNILVNDTTRVTLVDCDSMQFTDPEGHQFLCGVGRPEFTAPELAGRNLAVTAREKPSDLFALAVHIHQLLMGGNHPFQRGAWRRGGEQPDALTLAKTGQWAGGPGSALHTHPLAPPIGFLPDRLQALFVRAFTDGVRNPDARPTAAEWRHELLAVQVGNCARGHQIPIEAEPCPWCTIDGERAVRRSGVTPQGPVAQTAYPVSSPRTSPRTVGHPSPATSFTSISTPPAARRGRPLLIAGGVAIAALVGVIVVVASNIGGGDTMTAQRTTSSSGQDSYSSGSRTTGATATPTFPAVVRDASAVALNVRTPITQPACDGMGIVVLRNATTPGKYDMEIQRGLDSFPGASYLRTDHSCPSLRQVSDAGTPIYAVYRPGGRTPGELCAAVRRAGGDAYGKWLDMTTDPKFIQPC
ncbi:hypothetical protein [Mycolicibacterium fortuitum]|uniref:hypothetical protein n=1 Tax=Mycolicibacterium fortuitum TaxID=1766 RepID=UPI003AAF95B3